MNEADLFLAVYLRHYRFATDRSGRRWRAGVKRFLTLLMADYGTWGGVYVTCENSIRSDRGTESGNRGAAGG